MFAAKYEEYGDAWVLQAGDLPEPHACRGQVRITVYSAAVNPFDWKLRSNMFAVLDHFPAKPDIWSGKVVFGS